jgi:hypothetical protein
MLANYAHPRPDDSDDESKEKSIDSQYSDQDIQKEVKEIVEQKKLFRI